MFNEYLGVDSSDMTDEEVARYLPRFREVLAERLFAVRLSSPGGPRDRSAAVTGRVHAPIRNGVAGARPSLPPRSGAGEEAAA